MKASKIYWTLYSVSSNSNHRPYWVMADGDCETIEEAIESCRQNVQNFGTFLCCLKAFAGRQKDANTVTVSNDGEEQWFGGEPTDSDRAIVAKLDWKIAAAYIGG